MKNRITMSIVTTLGVTACATPPSSRLVEARRVYRTAERMALPGTTQVFEAEYALERAEEAHDEHPGSDEAKHQAYVAQRRAQRALTVVERDRAAAAYVRIMRRYGNERERIGRFVDLDSHDQEEDVRSSLDVLQRAVGMPDARAVRFDEVVEFEAGSATLDRDAKERLRRLTQLLIEQAPRHAIVVVGHTDAVGTRAQNEDLSLERAEAVKDFLVVVGVAPSVVDVIARGESRPAASNSSERGRELNRRVQLVIAALAE